jgi:UDP-2-acetamido-2,6-beta-L-arabino-hexul-4-ose reductase
MESQKKKNRVGITGQSGFIGSHLYNTLSLYKEEFELIEFRDEFFNEDHLLNQFISSCDTIVHLAAVNRHADLQVIYNTNIQLVQKLIESLDNTQSNAHVLFSSSTQEEKDNPYGRSKKEGRILFVNWAERSSGSFTGLVIPNVFGPFGNPFYNSVISTFSYQLNHDETPKVDIDAELSLIYIGELVELLIQRIRTFKEKHITPKFTVSHTHSIRVSEILNLLKKYRTEYIEKGIIPSFNNRFEVNLFNTFRSYINLKDHYPVKYIQNRDTRGTFVEIIRLSTGGQVNFSTTKPGIVRGNHFHTRKIERFSVIKGEALIQLRRIGSDEVMELRLSGAEPAYVDMPVWYTHSITNTGSEDLYTIFWVNEFYDSEDPDTFYEKVV